MTNIHSLITLLLAVGLVSAARGNTGELERGGDSQRQTSATGAPTPRPGAPYVGVSYYPEIARDAIDGDIRHMKDIGINLVRFGDFAWSRLEPQENQMDFTWMRQAIDKFAAADIAVTLCTPTAAPPVWLSESHPEILRVSASGQRIGHGGRRQYCPNSPVYRDYSRRLAGQLGRQFGRDPAVLAWQIDNEFWEECYCNNCLTSFRQWLQQRYGDIATLNRLWLTDLWSQAYQNFGQIPLPNPQQVGGRHHPSLRLAYRRFMSDSYVSFCMVQVQELRQHTAAPITTNGHNPRYQRIDYADLFRGLDLIGTDSYAEPTNLLRYAFEADWMRALGGKPFWLAETSSTLAAATDAGGSTEFVHTKGALRAKMWLNYALGAEAVSFWLWRAHWAGQELEHGSLIYPWGDETANTPEIRQVARELAEHRLWLTTTRPKPATVALHYGVPTQWQFEASGIASGFDYDTGITAFHRLLAHTGVPRDVISQEAMVDHYRVVCSPYLPFLDDALVARMRRFVENGGTWLLGPLSACRTADATAFSDGAYGAAMERWLGIHVRHRLPADPSIHFVAGNDTGDCKWWCDAYEPAADRKVLGRYAGGALDGMAAAVECRVGKGRVILLGTQPPDTWLQRLMRELAGTGRFAATAGVEVCERVDAAGDPAGVIAVNTGVTPAEFTLDGKSHLLEGYGVAVLPTQGTTQK